MAIDYSALRAELLNDPLARGYSGMTTAQKVASLNTKDREVNADREVRAWDIINTIPLAQQSAIVAHADATVQYYWGQFNQYVESGIALKPDAPPVTVWFNYFRSVASPPITAGTRSDIRAMGKEVVSRVVELKITFGDDITEGAVTHAETKL